MNPDFRGFGDFSDPSVLLSAVSIVICFILYFLRIKTGGKEYRIRSSLLIAIVVTTVIGIPMGVVQVPHPYSHREVLHPWAILLLKQMCWEL